MFVQNSNKDISNELIIMIFDYLIDDLFDYPTKNVCLTYNKSFNYPRNMIKNVCLTSKKFNSLFELIFKERFTREFSINLKLYNINVSLLRCVIYNSILTINNTNTGFLFQCIDNDKKYISKSYFTVKEFFRKLGFYRLDNLLSNFYIPNCGIKCRCELFVIPITVTKNSNNYGREYYYCLNRLCRYFKWKEDI